MIQKQQLISFCYTHPEFSQLSVGAVIIIFEIRDDPIKDAVVAKIKEMLRTGKNKVSISTVKNLISDTKCARLRGCDISVKSKSNLKKAHGGRSHMPRLKVLAYIESSHDGKTTADVVLHTNIKSETCSKILYDLHKVGKIERTASEKMNRYLWYGIKQK